MKNWDLEDFPHPMQIARWRRMTPAEKYASAMSLIDFARRFQASGLHAQHPDWTEAQVKAEARRWFHVFT